MSVIDSHFDKSRNNYHNADYHSTLDSLPDIYNRTESEKMSRWHNWPGNRCMHLDRNTFHWKKHLLRASYRRLSPSDDLWGYMKNVRGKANRSISRTDGNGLNRIAARNPGHIGNDRWNNIETNIRCWRYNWHSAVSLQDRKQIFSDLYWWDAIRTTNTVDRGVIGKTLATIIDAVRVVDTVRLNDASILVVGHSRIDH